MIVQLLTEHHFEFLSLNVGCRGSFESCHIVGNLLHWLNFFKSHRRKKFLTTVHEGLGSHLENSVNLKLYFAK